MWHLETERRGWTDETAPRMMEEANKLWKFPVLNLNISSCDVGIRTNLNEILSCHSSPPPLTFPKKEFSRDFVESLCTHPNFVDSLKPGVYFFILFLFFFTLTFFFKDKFLSDYEALKSAIPTHLHEPGREVSRGRGTFFCFFISFLILLNNEIFRHIYIFIDNHDHPPEPRPRPRVLNASTRVLTLFHHHHHRNNKEPKNGPNDGINRHLGLGVLDRAATSAGRRPPRTKRRNKKKTAQEMSRRRLLGRR